MKWMLYRRVQGGGGELEDGSGGKGLQEVQRQAPQM